MIKTKTRQIKINYIVIIAFLSLAVFGVFSGLSSQSVKADPYQAEINALNAEIAENQNTISQLQNKKDTLENALAKLNAEINNTQKKIDLTQAQIKKTKNQLAETQKELTKQKKIMQENAKTLYKNGTPSTLEILFASDNFTEFVNEQEYLEKVKEAINEAARETTILKEELEQQQTELEKLQQEQKGHQKRLVAKRAEQQAILDETRGQEARYQQRVASQQAELERMKELQRQAYAAAASAWGDNYITVGGSGGYPWAGQGLYLGCSGSCVDPWNLYIGQCVSYVAWRLDNEGYKVYGFDGMGNAAQWPHTTTNYWASIWGSSNAAKIRSAPRAGYAVVDPGLAAPYGHVMYVERVNGDGTIRIAEYNFSSPDTFSRRDISPAGLIFLEFARK